MANFEGERKTNMTCAEFQRALPFIIESGGNPAEEEHLRDCAKCSDLVRDLKYIAEQAKLLLPMRDPNPRVWDGIRDSLEREGMVRPSGNMVRLRPEDIKRSKFSWTVLGTITALLLVGFVLVRPRATSGTPQVERASATTPAPQASAPANDDQIVRAVAERNPDLRATYEKSLRDVNEYIRTAQQTVTANPDDLSAQEHLMQAYQQKAMLYDMALSRATQ